MVILLKFRFYFIFCIVIVLSTFSLLLTLLRYSVIRYFIVPFYLYEDDSNRQNIFDQSNISNYDHQYDE